MPEWRDSHSVCCHVIHTDKIAQVTNCRCWPLSYNTTACGHTVDLEKTILRGPDHEKSCKTIGIWTTIVFRFILQAGFPDRNCPNSETWILHNFVGQLTVTQWVMMGPSHEQDNGSQTRHSMGEMYHTQHLLKPRLPNNGTWSLSAHHSQNHQ